MGYSRDEAFQNSLNQLEACLHQLRDHLNQGGRQRGQEGHGCRDHGGQDLHRFIQQICQQGRKSSTHRFSRTLLTINQATESIRHTGNAGH